MKNKPGSAAGVPCRVGRKPQPAERQSAAEINRKLTESLRRLGDPVANYRQQNDQMVRRRKKKL
jgi:hypothetical protein